MYENEKKQYLRSYQSKVLILIKCSTRSNEVQMFKRGFNKDPATLSLRYFEYPQDFHFKGVKQTINVVIEE